EGLFATPVPLPLPMGGVLVTPTAWWGKEDGIVEVGPLLRAYRTQEGRVSASAVVTDLNGDGIPEAIVGTEAGQLVALGKNGARTQLANLKGAIEAPAMLADTDGDGTYELLVASNDGMLTCFSTGSLAKPVVSRFRGESPQNRGALGAVKLVGWALAP
ncbi:MAG: VCBS repeat-containing protein, partial [Polyangiaceae bacterium]